MEIKEPFVTYEVAIILKELGFNEPCACHWERGTDNNKWGLYMSGHWSLSNNDLIEQYLDNNNEICGEFSAPTWEQAIKFLLSGINLVDSNNDRWVVTFNGEFNIERQSYYDSEGYFIYPETEGNIETINKLIELWRYSQSKHT